MQYNSLTEFFFNTEYNVIDIRASSNTQELSVSDYILSLLLHNSFKSFDGGETFVGSITELLTTGDAIQYRGNLGAVIKNASRGEEQDEVIIQEVRNCLQTGIDEGIFSLASQNDIAIKYKGNICYITINIVVNKRRQSIVFYYTEGINRIMLLGR